MRFICIRSLIRRILSPSVNDMSSMNQVVYFLLILTAVETVLTQGETYTAGVVEFSPETNINDNIISYEAFMKNASNKAVDIIVFPEIGVAGYGTINKEQASAVVPNPSDNITPCDFPDETYGFVKNFSCAAKENNIYLVINIFEKEECQGQDGCPKEGRRLFNTNVVFSRKGEVVARYRKFNLFGEAGLSVTEYPQLAFFDTDFGVRFGIFTCFDLMFEQPTLQLVNQLGIKNIIFPTAWFSELPFLTALQAQQMWSYANNVNFLGSGYDDPRVGSGGSAIFSGRAGPLASLIVEEKTSQLLIAQVPKIPSAVKSQDRNIRSTPKAPGPSFFLKRDKIDVYASVSLEDLEDNSEVCFENFCCAFNVTYTAPEAAYQYRAVVFDGVRSFDGVATGGVQICAIVSCTNDTFESCGLRMSPKHSFTAISIKGNFKKESAFVMPSTVKSTLYPVSPADFTFVKECGQETCDVVMNLANPLDDILTFGIYNRDFSRDGQSPTESSSITITPTLLISLISFIVLGLC